MNNNENESPIPAEFQGLFFDEVVEILDEQEQEKRYAEEDKRMTR